MLHLCEDADIIGTPFYVMERMIGRVFHVNSVPDVTAKERHEIWDAMNEALARIHLVDWNACGLTDFGKPGNYFTRQVGRWGKQWHLSKQSDIPEMELLIEWLDSQSRMMTKLRWCTEIFGLVTRCSTLNGPR